MHSWLEYACAHPYSGPASESEMTPYIQQECELKFTESHVHNHTHPEPSLVAYRIPDDADVNTKLLHSWLPIQIQYMALHNESSFLVQAPACAPLTSCAEVALMTVLIRRISTTSLGAVCSSAAISPTPLIPAALRTALSSDLRLGKNNSAIIQSIAYVCHESNRMVQMPQNACLNPVFHVILKLCHSLGVVM